MLLTFCDDVVLIGTEVLIWTWSAIIVRGRCGFVLQELPWIAFLQVCAFSVGGVVVCSRLVLGFFVAGGQIIALPVDSVGRC
jgi:hypothetical protein